MIGIFSGKLSASLVLPNCLPAIFVKAFYARAGGARANALKGFSFLNSNPRIRR